MEAGASEDGEDGENGIKTADAPATGILPLMVLASKFVYGMATRELML